MLLEVAKAGRQTYLMAFVIMSRFDRVREKKSAAIAKINLPSQALVMATWCKFARFWVLITSRWLLMKLGRADRCF
jgi:hypothetical protein